MKDWRYPNGFSSNPLSPGFPLSSGFSPLLPPELDVPEMSTVVCPAFCVLSTARVAVRVGTGENSIPANIFFSSSPGMN